ncbi:MAG: hypothetical protein Q8P26_03265, partial [Candidatus Levybacteria bacterium]|nr:hypothetical protein [Candidatus Levybacteria bacterium]
PSRQRFGFSSDSHVGISAFDFFGSSDPLVMATLVRNDKDKTIYNKLKEMNVKEIIVPYDSEGELFIVDRKYNDLLRQKVIAELDSVEWLNKNYKFVEISAYEIQ